MSQSELNDKFWDKLGGYSSDIDHDQLWSAIADEVPSEKKKRRGVFWIWGFAGIGLVGFVAAYLFLNPDLSSNIKVKDSNFARSKKDDKFQVIETVEVENILNDDLSLERNVTAQVGVPASDEAKITLDKAEVRRKNSKSIYQVNSAINTINKKDEYIYIVLKTNTDRQDTDELKAESENGKREPSKQLLVSNTPNNSDFERSVANLKTIDFIQLPTLMTLLQIPERDKPVLNIIRIRNKRLKPLKKPAHILQVNYSVGNYRLSQTPSPDHPTLVDDGDPYLTQGVDLKYGHFITDNIYATVGLNYEVNYKHFQANIERDTIVPSSLGEQLLATYLYEDGKIDNISGVPEVVASFTRSVSNLNTFKSLNVGLGLGYLMKMKGVRVHVEGRVTRSIYTGRYGLAIGDNEQRISNLSSLSDLYSTKPNYNAQLEIGVSFPIYKKCNLVSGAQYQRGLSNQISILQGDEYYDSLKGFIGLRLVL